MNMSLKLFIAANWGVVVVYVLATILNTSGVIFKKENLVRFSYIAAGIGLTLHSALLILRWIDIGHGPYLSASEVLSSDAWIILVTYFVFLKIYPRISQASLLVFPLTFLMLALAMFSDPGIRTLPVTFRSIWLIIHIGLYKISLATLVIACASSVFYLLKKRREAEWMVRLPDIATLDVYAYRFAGIGFIFWTIGMLAGSIWAHQSWGRFWGWDPAETWALITCLMFGLYLHLRRFFQWKGTRAAWFFILCFIVSLLSLFVMATLKGSIHSEYFR